VKLRENILETEPNILPLFMQEDRYRFWKDDNKPKILENDKFFMQKMNYIHNNPVVKGYVDRPEYWKWSSANCDSEIRVDRW
jgi:REP element-mobilizing transposase RayT